MNFLYLTAEATNAAATGEGSIVGMIVPIVLMFVVFYLFLIRPEKKRKKEVDAMRSSLKVGDTVTTIGGIIGTVTRVNEKEDVISIKSGNDGTELCFARWAIGTKASKEDEASK